MKTDDNIGWNDKCGKRLKALVTAQFCPIENAFLILSALKVLVDNECITITSLGLKKWSRKAKREIQKDIKYKDKITKLAKLLMAIQSPLKEKKPVDVECLIETKRDSVSKVLDRYFKGGNKQHTKMELQWQIVLAALLQFDHQTFIKDFRATAEEKQVPTKKTEEVQLSINISSRLKSGIVAIILAAGKSTRMQESKQHLSFLVKNQIFEDWREPDPNSSFDKLWMTPKHPEDKPGKPIIAYTWQIFDNLYDIDWIRLVIRDGMQVDFQRLAEQFKFKKKYDLIIGGSERQDSVWNALQKLPPETNIVLIHDGARPCTDKDLILETIKVASKTGAAVAAQKVTDTIKESADGLVVQRTLDREKLFTVQTPQTFKLEVLQKALDEVRRIGKHVTDDAAACEHIKQEVRFVTSPVINPKLTVVDDLPLIETLLKHHF
jgi:2-C-methyl-D-erythritol 4-phosphate cytidylyltransferase